MTSTPTEVKKFFDAHSTVRKYKNTPMPPEHLDVILHAAQRAPTDATAQMYSFIRLVEPALRTKVAELSKNAHIATASEAFIICADVFRLQNIVELAGREFGYLPHMAVHFGIGDAVMAGQNMLIAAEMLGYLGCWIGGIMTDLEGIAQELKLPNNVLPFAGLTIGVPDETPKHRPRLERSLVVHENYYTAATREQLQRNINAMASITSRGDWAQTLAGYFDKTGSMTVREKIVREFLNKRFGLV